MRYSELIKKGLMFCVVLLLVTVPLLTACGGDNATVATPTKTVTPKPTETEVPTQTEQPAKTEQPVDVMDNPPIGEVKVGHLGDLTGPASSIHLPWCEHLMLCWDWLNDNGGIIYDDPVTGEKERVLVKAIMVDTQYKAENAISAFERFNEEGVVLHESACTGMNAAVLDLMSKYEIPTLNGAFVKLAIAPDSWYYMALASMAEEYTAAATWLVDKWESGEEVVGVKPDSSRKMRIGFMQSEASWGYKWYEQEAMVYMKSIADCADAETYPAMPTDVSAQLMKVDRFNPDYIFNLGITGETAVLLRDAKRLGITAPILTCAGTSVPDIIEVAGAEACENTMFTNSTQPFGMDSKYGLTEGAQLTLDIIDQYDPDLEPSTAMNYFSTAYMVIGSEVIKRALEEVGYENLTGKAVKEYGFNTLNDYDPMGLFATSITWADDDHFGCEGVNLLTIKDGVVVPLAMPAPIPTEHLSYETEE